MVYYNSGMKAFWRGYRPDYIKVGLVYRGLVKVILVFNDVLLRINMHAPFFRDNL
jgi:hypothetical protein